MSNPVTELLNSFVDRKMASGVSCLVTKDGQEAYFGCCGQADIEQSIPFRRDTLLHVYSMTKLVTSATVMTLLEQGSLALFDPVARFIPEFADMQVCVESNGSVEMVPARRQITIFDLLTMTSGIPYPSWGDSPVKEAVTACYGDLNRMAKDRDVAGDPMDTLDFIREVAKRPLCFHPGESWMYGMGSDVLGAVVVAITGKSLGAYMDEKIFQPLGMRETGFRMPSEKTRRIATVYTDSPDGLIPHLWGNDFNMVDHPKIESGGGGLLSTLDDFTRFSVMLMNRGELDGVRILSEDSVRQMTTNQLDTRQMEAYGRQNLAGYGYGLTMRVMMDPDKSDYDESVGAFGWNGGLGTTARIDPARGVTVVFGVQRLPANHPDFLPALSNAIGELF